MKFVLIILSVLVLLVLLLLPVNPFYEREAKVSKGVHMMEEIYVEPKGWTVSKMELAATEAAIKSVEKTLNYDDNFYYKYERGAVSFTVYAAYWGAGKMPAQLVASHTPDRCWTENGMECQEMEFNVEKSVQNEDLLPAQWRIFTVPPSEDKHYVLYWHLIDGEVYDFGERFNAVPHPLNWMRDAIKDALLGTQEQYFIRLVSNVPFEEIWDDAGVQEVMAKLSTLGLRRNNIEVVGL